MTRRVVKREEAKRDLGICAAFIQGGSPEFAIRFLEAAEECFQGLADMRYKGIQYEEALDPNLRQMRRFGIKGFEKYLVFYLPIENGIEVVRIIHGARDIEAIF